MARMTSSVATGAPTWPWARVRAAARALVDVDDDEFAGELDLPHLRARRPDSFASRPMHHVFVRAMSQWSSPTILSDTPYTCTSPQMLDCQHPPPESAGICHSGVKMETCLVS